MHRRTFLAATGVGLAGLAGCLGESGSAPEEATRTPTREPTEGGKSIGSTDTPTPEDLEGPMHGDDLPADDDPGDGYPSEFDRVPAEREIDTDSYERLESGVALAPIEDVYYWYARREARFVDARSTHAFDRSHVFGAVSSPVGGVDGEDPVESFPTEDRIITYCGCPHHLSSMRAEELMDAGYEEVYAIDEGYREWNDREYPMAGEEAQRFPTGMTLRGRTDPDFAGETAWARHQPTGQMEATDIRADGSYEMALHFYDVSTNSRIEVETPEYTVEAPLLELSTDVITGP